MRRTIRFLPLLATTLMLSACDDAAGPAPPANDLDVVVPALAPLAPPPPERPAFTNDPGEDADIPDGFDDAPAILTSRVTAGFTNTRAYAQAMMRFWGNRGRQDVLLDLYYNGSKVGSRPASGRKSEIFPGFYRIDTTASMVVNDKCGHTADATSDHEAWHEWGGNIWDQDTQQNGDNADQPECVDAVDEERVVPGGSNEDDSDWMICYYTHYYDTDSGRYLYTEFHGCEPL